MWDESLPTQSKRGKKENNAKENSRIRHRRITKFFMQDTVQSLKRGCTVFCFMQKS